MGLGALRRAIALVAVGVALLALAPGVSADEGWATWYGPGFDGKRMSNGQIFDMNDPTTVASNYLAFGTWLKVTNTANGKSVWVQVRDRGPFGNAGVKLDLSYAAAAAIAVTKPGTMWVRFEVVSGPGAEPAAPTSTPLPATWTLGPMPTRTPTRTPTLAPFVPTSTPTRTPLVPTSTPLPTATQVWTATSTVVPPTITPTASIVSQTPTATPSWTATASPTPQTAGSATAIPTATPQRSSATAGVTPAPTRYVVRPGETLWSIVRRFGLDIDDVQEANDLASPDSLRAGQTLVLGLSQASPVPTPEAAAAPAPTPTAAAPSREALAGPPTVAPVTPIAESLVGAGAEENVLSDIAFALGISFEELARANDLGRSASVIGDSPALLTAPPASPDVPTAAAVAPTANVEAVAAAEAPTAGEDAPVGQSTGLVAESGAIGSGQVVPEGGALFEIGLRVGVSHDDLDRLNGLLAPLALWFGGLPAGR